MVNGLVGNGKAMERLPSFPSRGLGMCERKGKEQGRDREKAKLGDPCRALGPLSWCPVSEEPAPGLVTYAVTRSWSSSTLAILKSFIIS